MKKKPKPSSKPKKDFATVARELGCDEDKSGLSAN
jgi:hypothetical protein